MQGNQAKVKVERNQAKVERNQEPDQDVHLTRPHMGVGRAANHVAPPSHQLAELGMYRLGQEDNGEVTLTALLAWAARRV